MIAFFPLVERLARALAKRLPPCFPADELLSVGLAALHDAIASYDPARGRLSVWLLYKTKAAMLDSVRRRNWEESTRLSLDQPNESGTGTLRDLYRAPDFDPRRVERDANRELDVARLRASVRRLIAEMPARTARVLTTCYVEGRQLQDAARELGLTKSRISQIHQLGLRSLAHGLTAGGMPVAYEDLARRIFRAAAA